MKPAPGPTGAGSAPSSSSSGSSGYVLPTKSAWKRRQEVNARKQGNEYNAEAIIAGSHRLSEVLSAIRGGGFSPGDPGRYVGLVDGISWHDTFMVCADFEAYWQAQLEVEERWRDPARWECAALVLAALIHAGVLDSAGFADQRHVTPECLAMAIAGLRHVSRAARAAS